MKIKPSWKEKRRYLLIELKKSKLKNLKKNFEKLKKKEVEKIKKWMIKLHGILGYAKARPIFIDLKQISNTNYLIMSVNRKYLSVARAAVLLSQANCVYVSGTLKKLKKRIKEIEKEEK